MKNKIMSFFGSDKVAYLYVFFIFTFGVMAYIDIKQSENDNRKLVTYFETSKQINSIVELQPIIPETKPVDITKYENQVKKLKAQIAALNKRLSTRVIVYPM